MGPLELTACEPELSELETPPHTHPFKITCVKKAFLRFQPSCLNPLLPLELECQLLYLGMQPHSSCLRVPAAPARHQNAAAEYSLHLCCVSLACFLPGRKDKMGSIADLRPDFHSPVSWGHWE